ASPGYPWPESWGRIWSRKVRETRSASSQKRSERGRKYWQRVERNRSPSPTPAGGPVAKPEITSSGRVTPFLGTRETWLVPNVLGAWGVTTLSANLAGDDSWVAGIELA